MDKFTIKSQEAIQEAQRFAEKKGNQQLDAEHLLWALLDDDEGVASQILKRLGINTETLKQDVEEAIDRFPKVIGATPLGQIYISPRLKEVFENAHKKAEHLKDEYVSVEHLLVALVSIGGPCSDLLKRYAVTARQGPRGDERDQGRAARDRSESRRQVSGPEKDSATTSQSLQEKESSTRLSAGMTR